MLGFFFGWGMMLGNFQSQCFLLILNIIIVGQGPTILAAGMGGGIFFLAYHISFLFPTLLETCSLIKAEIQCTVSKGC